MPRPADELDGLLYRALHRYLLSGERWAELRKRGAGDADLLARVNEEFGHFGYFVHFGSGEAAATFDAGKNPRLWRGTPTGPPAIEGQALIDAARRVLRIPRPHATDHQAHLFESKP